MSRAERERKTQLTFEEKITAAFMHFVRDIDQQDIAIMMGGVNSGRVNEACTAIRNALAVNYASGSQMQQLRERQQNDPSAA